ncbi:hypothetical protein EDI_151260 [Entamoeba dispar SAW760]|uniref:Serine/threonine-protein phosphatase 6 regulatory subunit n=1 Tax=Entamoeba dispar (strain ATCC PRA-260 / SAW760) TaxID=370354 RepID=B0EQ59_ENTDS|nr:uncharacterized protein EDI_151260 [Entamoeba dispar SAW760]EDR23347.1 hypothetical protein EDI_151260 [Entamoeba dispar SAW760]|eukprot:EDR23347.1 hypothetical protein EDI_151260 [Entamoeba dispar SAW760]
MNYWTGMFQFPPMQSPIDILLGKEDCTLEKLMNDEDFIQELRSNNDLIEFCSEPYNLKRILQYTTEDFPEDVDKNLCSKYHIICSSMFGDEPVKVVDAIGTNPELVNYLFDALLSENEKRMSAAGQVLMSLVQVDGSVVYDLFIANENILETIMAHQDLTGLLETILQIMKLEDSNEKTGYINWICERNFISRMLETLMTTKSIDTIGNISSFIHNVVLWKVSSVDSPALQFITRFNNEPTLKEFIRYVFASDDDFLVEQCFRIISNILACSTVLTYSDLNNLPGIFKALMPHVCDFEKVFTTRKVGSITNNLVYIILSLVLSGFQQVYDTIVKENVLGSMMDIFYGDHLCTIVRQTIQMTVSSILNGKVNCLKLRLLDGGNLLTKMVEKDKEAVEIKNVNNIAPDYWLIANQIMINTLKSVEDKDETSPVYELVMGNNEFVNYVKEVVLPRDEIVSDYFVKPGDQQNDSDEYTDDSIGFQEDDGDFDGGDYEEDEDGVIDSSKH